MESLIKMKKTPSLRFPYLVAAWPGMGNVAISAATHLQGQLKAECFAEMEPGDLFHIAGIFIHKGLVATPQVPENTFYYWKNENSDHDLIIFIGTNQPIPGKEQILANQIFLALESFQIHGLITFAAMPTAMQHHQIPKVWATASSPKLLNGVKYYCDNVMKEGHISGMNGFILGMAKKRGIEGYCFLGEIPHYTTQVENPRSSKAVLQVAIKLLNISIDLTEMDHLADYMERQIDQYLQQLKDEMKSEKDLTSEDKGSGYVH
jgi:proteasome assembly chaperone (PAC2) family protein